MLKTRNLKITLDVTDADGAVSHYHFQDLADDRKLELMRGVEIERDGETPVKTTQNLHKLLSVSLAMFGEMLIGWDGVVDVDGEPLEYSEENKSLAMQYEKDFCIHMAEAAQKKFAERNKEIKKKSVNGPNGSLSPAGRHAQSAESTP